MKVTRGSIITLPNDHLRQRSKKVAIVTDEVKRLIADMEAATLDWEDSRKHEVGVAMAAIQIDQPLRVVIVRNNFDEKKDRGFTAFINPEVTKFAGDIEEDYEGCLSVKDIYGKVPRHTKIRIKAMNLDGKEVRVTAEGFLARVLQHEIDHTNGVVFIDNIKNSPQAFFELLDDGKLEPLDYDKDIKNNKQLWD
jgi:peptide deformylase